jgi:hypothetical protein
MQQTEADRAAVLLTGAVVALSFVALAVMFLPHQWGTWMRVAKALPMSPNAG